MVEDHWDDLRGREIRYDDRTWELNGDVVVRKNGRTVDLAARRTDAPRRESATLSFELENPPDALNPGNLGSHFDSVERTEDGYHLRVKTAGRTYRYKLRRIRYD